MCKTDQDRPTRSCCAVLTCMTTHRNLRLDPTTTTMSGKDAEETDPWQYSSAKKLLEKDIIDGIIGTVETGMLPCQVYLMRPEYADYEYDRFVSNLYSLRVKYEKLLYLAQIDGEALAHDLALGLRTNSKPYPHWQGSEAERLLQEDINNGKHLGMKPQELRNTHAEYKVYPLKVFRDHIQQELRARKERPYWMARRKEKEEEKRKEAAKKAKKSKEKAKKSKEKALAAQKK